MSAGKYIEWDVCVTPPHVSGASTTPKTFDGCRAKALTTTTSETVLDGDVLLAPPDGGGNQATSNFTGRVLLRITADGGEVDVILGAKGAGIVVDPAAVNGTNDARICDIIPQNAYLDYWIDPKTDQSIYARARSGSSTIMRYRISSPIPGTR